MISRTKGLSRKTAGAHANKGAVPVDEVEDGNTYRECTYGQRAISTAGAAGDKRGGDTHKWYRDVRYNIRYGYAQYLSIHCFVICGRKVTQIYLIGYIFQAWIL